MLATVKSGIREVMVMKKRYYMVPAAMALLLLVCAGENKLPEGFDKNAVYKTARNFILNLNKKEYNCCYSLFNKKMQTAMDREKLQSTLDSVLASLGEFVRFKGISAAPKKILGQDYTVCTVKCVYENGSATYTLSLDRDLKIGGLYIK